MMSTLGPWGIGSASSVGGPIPMVQVVGQPDPEPIELTEREARAVYADDPEMLKIAEAGHKLVVQPGTEEYGRAVVLREQLEYARGRAQQEVYERAREDAERRFEDQRDSLLAQRIEGEVTRRVRAEVERITSKRSHPKPAPYEPVVPDEHPPKSRPVHDLLRRIFGS